MSKLRNKLAARELFKGIRYGYKPCHTGNHPVRLVPRTVVKVVGVEDDQGKEIAHTFVGYEF